MMPSQDILLKSELTIIDLPLKICIPDGKSNEADYTIY